MGIARQSPPSPELKIFSDRLKKAIEFKKIDIAGLAKGSGYKPDDISKLLTGMREPSIKKLILLANTLGCSIDYLLGFSPEAKRASVVVSADIDAVERQSSGHGQISGKAERFMAMLPKLLESDAELLMHIAGFLIERKEKGLARLMKAVADSKSKKELEKEKSGVPPKASIGKPQDDDCDDGFDDDFDEEDELWDSDEDDFGDDEDFDDDYDDFDE
jgi:transcriptional regulator with XRE-family HTH domain